MTAEQIDLIDKTDDEPKEECGVFGVWAPGEDVAKLTYYGLYALQHRGQEAAGIAVADGSQVLVFKDLGLVAQVFDESALLSLQGSIAVGHTRYSTTGGSTWQNAQPTLGGTAGGTVALAHNGNLVNVHELLKLFETFRTIERPFLMHCKSGADRAGLAAALYMLAHGASPAEARRQLSWRFLHLRHSSTGILDHVLDIYEARLAQGPIGIEDWVRDEYDRDAATAGWRRW